MNTRFQFYSTRHGTDELKLAKFKNKFKEFHKLNKFNIINMLVPCFMDVFSSLFCEKNLPAFSPHSHFYQYISNLTDTHTHYSNKLLLTISRWIQVIQKIHIMTFEKDSFYVIQANS